MTSPGVIHNVYHVVNPNGDPVIGTGTIYPSEAHFEAHVRGDGFTVEVWTSAPAYASPVGTDAERAGIVVWPGKWIDATGRVWYAPREGVRWFHTGADLNLNTPAFDSDAHAPVYSIGDGEVYAVREYGGWGNVICIRHADCLSRYAHCENLQVREGERVKLADQIANIGNAGGYWPYHLHFDIARLDSRMARYPGDWPATDRGRVLLEYYDPRLFLMQARQGAR